MCSCRRFENGTMQIDVVLWGSICWLCNDVQDGKSACFEQYQPAEQCAVARTDHPPERRLLLIGRLAVRH